MEHKMEHPNRMKIKALNPIVPLFHKKVIL